MPLLNERDVETRIEEQLKNLEWIDNPSLPNRNVYKQNPKTEKQRKALGSKRPDYTLYRDNSDDPLIVIEAKRPNTNLSQALEQGNNYAKAINAPIVIATDGIFAKTFHTKMQKPLFLDKEEISKIIQQSLAIEYIDKNEYFSIDEKVIKSRDELLTIFKEINNQFKDAGVSRGLPRIELFCNLLFLKVITELVGTNSLIHSLPDWCTWDKIKAKKGDDLWTFINTQAFDYFQKAYGGDVLSPIETLVKPSILNTIVAKLDDLHLSATHSDIKGDAFEYFLRNYGGADTDFGEYFTPRHIVTALVNLLDPKFGEKVYDPFCGTGGMLITSYKHIYDNLSLRTPENIQRLKKQTVYGGEITKMYRIAKMNMILAGDGHSNIVRQNSYGTPDTIKQIDVIKDGFVTKENIKIKYDVVISNMPFGRKMKTEHAGLYGFNTRSAEITGVLHCLNSLNNNENARLGLIVPEGILFDSNTKAYVDLRKKIMTEYNLETIVSLPQQAFASNTGVKSDILIIKKQKQATQKYIWYFNVQNDGYTLDSNRRKIEGINDIDNLMAERSLEENDKERLRKLGFSILTKDDIKDNSYKFLPKREVNLTSKYNVVNLGDICSYESGKRPKGGATGITEGAISIGGEQIGIDGRLNLSKIPYIPLDYYRKSKKGFIKHNDILMCKDGALTGKVCFVDDKVLPQIEVMVNEHVYIIRGDETKVLQNYLFLCLRAKITYNFVQDIAQKTGQPGLSQLELESIEIPLPSMVEQQAIVKEIESIQKVIDGLVKAIENYKPTIEIKKNGK